ncbi:hypothetical protein CWI80_00155 [Pseudidiomarina sediminum]|uniref:Uncharacterized protein n=1 Tax=Pseudidiomarina sediminum TaxID=431675 RepID=A0A432Z7F4_9GAMM|nr:hypothetical protein [Pseudidiomarina sediminum]RUO73817.1 hypothetical protein CWI80_00155 [Pseudidiomarina sediminum]
MSKLDKDQVIADFTAAYEKAHGKKPTIEAKSGWYSVDGGKNIRLAQLAEEAEALAGGAPAAPAAKAEKKAAPKKAEAKQPAKKKAASKKASSGGLTARELWRQKLEQGATSSRLPRGS